jgi:hypothetical protein
MKYKWLMKLHNAAFFLTVLIFQFPLLLSGQGSLSPYGRYGLGDLSGGAQPVIEAMGGSSASFSDSGAINLHQPASLVSLGSGLVILEAGFTGSWGNYSYQAQKNTGNTAGFGYLSLAVPLIKNRWSAALSLSPFSSAGYSLRDTLTFAGNIPAVISSQASGGFSALGFSNGIRINKNLSLGIAFHYYFGRMDSNTETRFPDDPNIRSSSIVRTDWLNGLDLSSGLLYQHRFRRSSDRIFDSTIAGSFRRIYKGADSLHLITGFRFSPELDVGGRQGILATSFLGNQQAIDTLLFNDQRQGSIRFPIRTGFSLALKHSRDKWLLMTDISYTDWNRFRNFGTVDSVRSSYRISAGWQYIPRPESMYASWSNYFQKIKYRAGIFYSDGYLKPSGNAVAEMGLSIGFGLPFSWKTYAGRKATHTINLAITASQRGGNSSNELKEQIVRLTVAIAFNDRWFHKRQYE